MKTPIKKKIVEVLHKERLLSISQIAAKANISHQTTSVYCSQLYELGILSRTYIGSAICYALKNGDQRI